MRKLFKPERLLLIIRHYRQYRKYKGKNIEVGFDSIIINSNFEDRIWIGDHCRLINCEVSKHTYFGSGTKVRNTTVGAFCSISFNVQIGIGKHPTNMVSTHPAFFSKDKPFQTFADNNYVEEYGEVKIGNDVWIGENVAIMFGVNIGDGAIIGYGAVVTKDVEPYSIVGGVPANFIRYRFIQNDIDFLRNSRWWNQSDEWLIKNVELMRDINRYKSSISNDID